MMDFPITTNTILQHCEHEYPNETVISGVSNGQSVQLTYHQLATRIKQLANALLDMGVKKGDRIATLAWNSHHHMELYYAIAGIGAICHTVNPRYSNDQISYILEHAKDRALFFDSTFANIAEQLLESKVASESLNQFVVFDTNGTDQEYANLNWASDFEALIHNQPETIEWPEISENDAAALCYTSGTTGNPKGVLYTHRSTFLHALVASGKSALDIGDTEVISPIVPMFHVNAWGIPYIAPMVGAKLVLPGPDLSPTGLFDLFDSNGVTTTAGVPTILDALLQHMQQKKAKPKDLHTIIVGGAAASLEMIKGFSEEFGLRVLHGWGMTETSPLATINTVKPSLSKKMNATELVHHKQKQGRKLFGIDIKIVDDTGNELPHDGKSQGKLLIRGAWVVDRYYGDDESATDMDGWFDTGDISTIDGDGYMHIVDRSKDVIKSGGEWISSVQLENTVVGHPDVAQAAVIGLPHPKWLERPMLIVVPVEPNTINSGEIKEYLEALIPKWWMPDAIVFENSLPIGATGKIQKNILREKYVSFKAIEDNNTQ